MRALGVALVLLSAGAAWAGPGEDAAREETRKAAVAYNLGSYEEAARHYEAAYRLVQDHVLLFNLGQCWRLGGQPEKALASYRAYLRTAPAGAQNRDLVQRRIEELEELVAAGRRSQVAPPPHTLALSEPGARPELTVTATPEPERPIYRRWWFWTGAAALATAAIVTTIVLSSSGGTKAPTTPLGNQPLFK